MIFVSLIARRVLLLAFILVAVSVLTFAIVNVLPGDIAAAVLGDTATPEQVAAVRERMGLNLPVVTRYLQWTGNILHGDFGRSLVHDQPISTMVLERLANSAILAAIVLLISVPLSVGLGIIAAIRQGSWIDRLISGIVVASFALPEFVIGLVLILVFAIWLEWLPGSSLVEPGVNPLAHPAGLVLPVAALTLHMLAHVCQVTRTSMLDALDSDYVRTAVLKGLSRPAVILNHALRNALLPAVSEVGMNFGYVLGGLVVIETLFSYAGLGQLMVTSVAYRDIPTIQISVLIVAAAYGVGNLVADIVSVAVNPRLRS